jgi:hypothetical protein
MRKIRSDAVLLNLSEDRQVQIAEWLSKHPYDQVKKFIKTEFGLTVSRTSIGCFWQKVCQAALIARYARIAERLGIFSEVIKGR